MDQKSSRFKNELRYPDVSPKDSKGNYVEEHHHSEIEKGKVPKSKKNRNMLGIMIIALMLIFIIKNPVNLSFNPLNVFSSGTSFVQSGPTESLLNAMGARMEEMGYAGLSHDDLRELRKDGVTATYVSNLRAIGFTEITLDDAVKLAKANASTAFISMMIELGFNLTVEEIVMLKDAKVTAHFTSNVHDLGYRDVTLDQLVRLNRIGVTVPLIQRLQDERGADITLEEIIRYRISNQ